LNETYNQKELKCSTEEISIQVDEIS